MFIVKPKDVCAVLIGVLFVMTGTVFAQPQGQPPSPPSASDIAASMKQELGLSDDQVDKVASVIQKQIQQMQAVMEQARDQKLSPDAMMSQMEAVRKNIESELAQYLTQEQLTQWKNKQQQPPQERGARRAPPPGGSNDR